MIHIFRKFHSVKDISGTVGRKLVSHYQNSSKYQGNKMTGGNRIILIMNGVTFGGSGVRRLKRVTLDYISRKVPRAEARRNHVAEP